MSTVQLRRQIKKAIDEVPRERLESLADYVGFLRRPPLDQRLKDAKKAIASGKGVNWRAWQEFRRVGERLAAAPNGQSITQTVSEMRLNR